MSWARRSATAIAIVALLVTGVPCAGQDASSLLPMDHWAHRALERLDGLGLLQPGHDPASRSLTVEEARLRIEGAERRATGELERLARGYRERLAAEVGRVEVGDRPRTLHGRALAGYGVERGRLEPGTSDWGLTNWSGPRPLPDASGARLRAGLGAGLLSWLAAGASVESLGSSVSLEEAYALVAAGPAGAWLGRRPGGYRPGMGGGVVLDSVTVDGGGLFLVRPVELPVVGRLGLETTLSRLSDNAWIGEPWLWAMRFSLHPHSRLGLGVSRAIMFGGERNEPATLRNLLYMLVGKHGGSGSGFENQVVSVDVRYRPPLPAPVVLRVEWGFDDSAGAWYDQPAMVAGAELAAVPGLPELALGVEHTRIAGEEPGHSIWYRHWWFHDGWVSDESSLGHPLGGHGREWLVYGDADVASAGVRVAAKLFLRDRGGVNVFAPDREGDSRGLGLDVEWRLARQIELLGGGTWEEGDGDWRQVSAVIGGRWIVGWGAR